jgi:hypothetical protein
MQFHGEGFMPDFNQRRSDRVLITLPVSVSGTDGTGTSFSEDATTVTVSQNGGAIAVKAALVPGQEIVIRRNRPRVPRIAECLVAGKVGEQPGLQVFSVAFRRPEVGFWDIYFPPLPANEDTAGRALLACKICGTRKVVHLDATELAAYNSDHHLSLNCTICGKSTIWRELQQETTKRPEVGPANPARLAPALPAQPKDQRKHRRVATEIPICIRQTGSHDDVATTVDISRGGLLFTSHRNYRPGSFVQIAVPFSPKALNVFVDARVAHSSKVASQELYRVGIMYLAENESQS